MGQPPISLAPLVDAHCHLFNITDLPAARFTQQVLLKDYAHRGPQRLWEIALGAALDDIEAILQAGVIRASDEAGPPRSAFIESVTEISAADEAKLKDAQQRGERALAEGAEEAFISGCESKSHFSTNLASIVGWLCSLRSSRTKLAAQLIGEQRRSGFSPELLCPALVDYCNWIGEGTTSPLPDQMRAAARLANNPGLPAIHGYMAFDPLRSALFSAGKKTVGGSWDPVAVLREALTDHGFLGVKVYPPMGFRPHGNATASQAYPPAVEDEFGGTASVGAALDAALEQLWQLCVELDAPILAHAANSNMTGRDFGRRADPTFWLPVADQNPELRILLGHFGRFGTYAAPQTPSSPCDGEVPFDQTWEAAIGRYVSSHPDCRLFADISFLSDIFSPSDRKRTLEGMKQYLKLDPEGRHLVYGSDWVMLGIEKEYPRRGGYAHRIAGFLQDCGLGNAAIEGVMRNNALRCLGLDSDTRARRRIEAFLVEHQLPLSRLPI